MAVKIEALGTSSGVRHPAVPDRSERPHPSMRRAVRRAAARLGAAFPLLVLAFFLTPLPPPAWAQNAGAGLVLSKSSATVAEGGTAAYTVKLATKPSGNVAVTVARKSAGQQDTDLTVTTGALLFFSPQNWSTPRYVILEAEEDTDALHGTAVFEHAASGADYDGVSKELTATEADNEVALVLSETFARVAEGGTATYTVKLKGEPTATVTVTVARKSGGDTNLTADTDSVANGDQDTLTFTTTDWNTAQTVTLSAADDTDNVNGQAVFTHTASGGQYAGTGAALTALEAENERGITISPAGGVTVPEAGAWAYYYIRLNAQPSGDVTVTHAKTGDENVAHVIGTPFTFTQTNWNQWQTMPVSASADDDGVDGTATITHTANGGDYANVTAAVTATEADDDRKFNGISPKLFVSEGGSGSFKMGLYTAPTGTVTITVTKKAGGDPSVTVDTDPNTPGNQNTFTVTKSYLPNDPQGHGTVKVIAGEDDDNRHSKGTQFTVTATGVEYDGLSKSFLVDVTDNDDAGLAAFRGLTGQKVSPTTAEVAWVPEGGKVAVPARLASRPNGTVTVKVTGNNNPSNLPFLPPHAHPRVTVDMDANTAGVQDTTTFTSLNWNTPQDIILSASEDNDSEDTLGSFKLAVSSVTDTNYTASHQLNVKDADVEVAGRTLTLSQSGVMVPEGGTTDYTVALASQPDETVTVTVARTSGDEDLSVATGATLTFTATDWSTAQTVTLAAKEDADTSNGSAVFTHTATGGWFTGVSATLTATEADIAAAKDGDGDAEGEGEDDLVADRALTLSASSVTAPEGGTVTYTVALAVAPTGPVTVAVTKNADGDPDLTAAPDSLTFTAENWSAPQTVTISAAADKDREPGEAVFTHTATGGGYGEGANATTAALTAVEEDNSGPKARERLAAVNEAILPEMLRAVVQHKIDHVVSRVVSEILPEAMGRDDALAMAADMLARHGKMVSQGGFSWREVLRDADFALPLSGKDGDARGGNGGDGVAFWAMGDYLHLSDDRPVEWRGDLFGFHMGADLRIGPNFRAGVGLSLEEGSFDYVNRPDNGDEVAGTQDIRMTSVYPYAGWRLPDGSNLWATAGYGEGKVEFDDDEAGQQTSDARQTMAAAGGTFRLAEADGPLAGGEAALTVRTQAAAGRLAVDDNGLLIPDMATSVYDLRVALEGAESIALTSGRSIEPSLEAGIRWDGGDGETGLGLELGGRLDYADPARGLTTGVRGRTLVAHASGLREWGASGWFRLVPDDSGRGWSFQATPSWGEAAGGVEKLWERGVAGDGPGGPVPVRFDTEIGYGLAGPPRGNGLLTCYAGLGLTEGASRSLRLGIRFEIGPPISIGIEGTRNDRASGTTDHALGLSLTMRW